MKLLSNLQSTTPRWFAPAASLFALLCTFVSLPQTAPAADRIWTGAGTNTEVRTPANWQGGVAATAGDMMIFNGSGTFSMKGADEIVSFNINAGGFGGSSTGMTGVKLTAAQRTDVFFLGDSTFAPNNAYMRISGATGTTARFILENGSGSLTIDGDHEDDLAFRITLQRASTSSGGANNEYINNNPVNGSKLVFGSDVLFNGGGSGAAHAIFSGPGSIDFYARYSIPSSNIIKRGTGILTLGGDIKDNTTGLGAMSAPGAFDGSIILEEGRLNINHAGALGDGTFQISGGVTIGNTSGNAIVTRYGHKNEIKGSFTFTGTNDLNLGTGAVTLSAPQPTITVDDSGRLEFGGNITGANVGLIKSGTGTLVLSGTAAANTGALVAANGAIMVKGSILNTTGTAASGGIIGGSGTVGVVTIASGGTLQPGDLTLVKAGTFAGTIGATYSTLTVDKSLSATEALLKLETGATIEFALGLGHTNTKVKIIGSAGATTPTVAFNNNVININDLTEGAFSSGNYLFFETNGTFDTDFGGLTLDANDYITGGLSATVPTDCSYKLQKTATGITLKIYRTPTITCDDEMMAVPTWSFSKSITFGGDYTASSISGLPAGLEYSDVTQTITGSPTAAAGTYTATISVSNPVITVTKEITIVVTDEMPAPVFTIDPVVARHVGPFSYELTASNLPQSYEIVGEKPAWMDDLNYDGTTGVWSIIGNPTAPGIYTVTLRVTNPRGYDDITLTIIIDDSTVAPVITSATSMVWVRDYALNYQITAANGPAFYGVSGTLPSGLTLNALTGAIAGTPSASGTSTVTMRAINATGTGSSPLTFDIMDSMPQPVITSSTTATGFLNQAFNYTITAANFVTSTTVTSVLPSWLSYDGPTATLSGTCPGDGASWAISGSTYPVVVEASNIVGTATSTVNIIIKQYYPIPVITNSGTNTCYAGRAYSDQIAVASTAGIESYSGTGLPAGLTVDPATGAIAGAPASAGNYTIILAARTSGGTGTGTIGLNVIPVPPGPFIDSPTTADGATGQAFAYQISAETGVTSYGAKGLPPGLSVDPATGLISGVPAAAGYYMVEISTTDSAGTFVQDVTLTLEPASSTIVTYAGALEDPGLVNANGTDARFNQPHAAAFSISGTIFVADFANNTIRAIATNGDVSSYVTAGQPSAVATDSHGNIYFANQQTGAIMKIFPIDQIMVPVASGLSQPGGLAIDAQDNVYFTESGASANVIRKISATNGAVTDLAGSRGAGAFANGIGAAAKFNGPTGLAYDQTTNTLYVADTLNSMIRGVNLTTNAVSTIAGMSGATGFWDGGSGAARFDNPQGLSIDAAGFLYIADTGNNTIRVCDPKSGFVSTLIGVPREEGAIDGNGSVALLHTPAGIIVDANGTGDIYIVDSGNSAIRSLVSPPCIVTPLVSATIKAGRPITLDGRAWGAPAPSYQWYKDGIAVGGAKGQANTLPIDSPKASDAGTYKIVAFSASGTVDSSMQLTVDTSSSAGGTVVIDGDGSGGGGGAPSLWFLFGLGALALCRRIFNFGRANKH